MNEALLQELLVKAYEAFHEKAAKTQQAEVDQAAAPLVREELRALREELAELREELTPRRRGVKVARAGLTAVEAAKMLGVSRKTFYSRFGKILKRGRDSGKYSKREVEALRERIERGVA